MPEFFLELFSEEIPARMQRDAADELMRTTGSVLSIIAKSSVKTYFGPRRIAIATTIDSEKPRGFLELRGPRETAPASALEGFLRKHSANHEEIFIESGYYVLRRETPAIPAATFIRNELPNGLAAFSWPKSMRWGQSDDFTWVRPLRRIICLLDGEVVPIKLGSITADCKTEGHRIDAGGTISVSSASDWQEKLRRHHVIVDHDERRQLVVDGITKAAATLGLTIAEDYGLIDEVTGLVEWPVPLIGKIDEQFMSLPPEVRELSMKVNQRYFALRDADGKPAPYFAFVANLDAPDGGAAIIAGNERVLRARLSDARHFWDLDMKTPLKDLLPNLQRITFHAKLGSQLERAERISKIAADIVNENLVAFKPNATEDASWAGRLCKADLTTSMVGEFPELQGVIGGYLAQKNGWSKDVSLAIRSHYQPQGPNDAVPRGLVPSAVALADKLDLLIEFFRIDEVPTGSGDPYALRRAALGVSRIILENKIDLSLERIIKDERVFAFIVDRLKNRLRLEGKRHDILSAVFAADKSRNLLNLMSQVDALTYFLDSPKGVTLLSLYRRAANILKAEEMTDGPHSGSPDIELFQDEPERRLAQSLATLGREATERIAAGDYIVAMEILSFLSEHVNDFFLKVTVNAPEPELRLNRLRLLAQLRDTMHQIADFSKIVG